MHALSIDPPVDPVQCVPGLTWGAVPHFCPFLQKCPVCRTLNSTTISVVGVTKSLSWLPLLQMQCQRSILKQNMSTSSTLSIVSDADLISIPPKSGPGDLESRRMSILRTYYQSFVRRHDPMCSSCVFHIVISMLQKQCQPVSRPYYVPVSISQILQTFSIIYMLLVDAVQCAPGMMWDVLHFCPFISVVCLEI